VDKEKIMKKLNQTSGWTNNLTGVTKALSMIMPLKELEEHNAVFFLPRSYKCLFNEKYVERLSGALSEYYKRRIEAQIIIGE
jgi:hypothetical protein